jgi:2-haloacid dehalogenase
MFGWTTDAPAMSMTRRDFVALAATGAAAGALASGRRMQPATKIKAIAFDAFPIFDPRPVFALADQLFPGKGADLSNEWRTRQFEYTWLRALAGRYADFQRITQDALVFAARKLRVDLSPQQRDQLVNAYLELKAWPDVPPALGTLKRSGYRLAFLSNFTPNMLDRCIRSAGLEGMFEEVLSTDRVQTYKPDPRAYRLGLDAMKLSREEILFVAFAGWDVAGARAFGYPTFWVNRLGLPAEELDEVADGSGGDLSSLVAFLGR